MPENDDKTLTNLKALYDIALDETSEETSPLLVSLKSLNERYTDWSQIASGGMKRIFRVYDQASERYVALAQLHENSPRELYDSFIREARLTGKLEHPNIMTVHDIAVNEQNEPYFTMELKSGGSLEEILQQRQLGNEQYLQKYPREKLLEIFLKVCDAMSYAHSKQVIHLDLKPANIQVGEFGEVLVCDWGLGKLISSADSAEIDSLLFNPDLLNNMTLSGHIKGTPGFMAPEQIEADKDKDERTDVYALGGILYAILTDCCPLQGSTEEKLQNALKGQIESPLQRFPHKDIPSALDAVTKKALQVPSELRYSSVNALNQEVHKHISGYSTTAENAGILKEFKLFWQRNRLVCRISTFSIFLVCALITAFIFQLKASRDKAQEERGKARTFQQRAERVLDLYENEKENLKQINKKWSRDMTLSTDELRYHFFFDAPQRYIKQTLVHLQKAIKIYPDNHRARALIGHQYFMMQQFNKANEIFAQSDYKQEDLHLFSKKFALLKTDDKKLLTISQLASLIDHINDNFDRRHHLCERLVVWDRLQRDNKYGYFPVIKELIASKNKGGQNYTFDFDLQSKKVKITGRGLTTLSEDTTIGSGRCLLRFLPIKTLDVSQTHFHNLWDIIALKDLETLDIRQTLVTRLEYLKELPKLKILILEKGQFSKRVLKWVPANVKIIYEKL